MAATYTAETDPVASAAVAAEAATRLAGDSAEAANRAALDAVLAAADSSEATARANADAALVAADSAETAARVAADAALVPLAQKGAPSGVASLDSGTQVPAAQTRPASATARGTGLLRTRATVTDPTAPILASQEDMELTELRASIRTEMDATYGNIWAPGAVISFRSDDIDVKAYNNRTEFSSRNLTWGEAVVRSYIDAANKCTLWTQVAQYLGRASSSAVEWLIRPYSADSNFVDWADVAVYKA